MSSRPPRRATRLSVTVTDAQGRLISKGPAAGLGTWLAEVAPARAAGALTIALVADSTMRRLNREFRGKDKATDVLSFPAPAVARGAARSRFLGDLAIAKGIAAMQARQLGHPMRVELRVLALHGLLHLLGYDHETDRGEMARIEDRLRKRAGLPAGLIARA